MDIAASEAGRCNFYWAAVSAGQEMNSTPAAITVGCFLFITVFLVHYNDIPGSIHNWLAGIFLNTREE